MATFHLKLFSSELLAKEYFLSLKEIYGERFAPVSLETPLLSNLSVLDNVALVKEYRSSLHDTSSKDEALRLLTRLHIPHLATKRNNDLSDVERFWVMMCRAAMVSSSCVVIDRPLSFVQSHQHLDFIQDALSILDEFFDEIVLIGLEWNEQRYKELLDV